MTLKPSQRREQYLQSQLDNFFPGEWSIRFFGPDRKERKNVEGYRPLNVVSHEHSRDGTQLTIYSERLPYTLDGPNLIIISKGRTTLNEHMQEGILYRGTRVINQIQINVLDQPPTNARN